MTGYIIRRLLLIIPTFFLVTLIIFFAVRFIPGNVIDLMVAEMSYGAISVEQQKLSAETIRHKLGMDVPVYVQYSKWLGILPPFNGVLEGNLGESIWTERNIDKDLMIRLPISLELGIVGILLGLLIALPIGTFSAIRQDSPMDYVGRTIAILCISLPSFWLGTMAVVYPSVLWGWMPPVVYSPLWENPVENIKLMFLPGFILGMTLCGVSMRMQRTMMLEVLRQDYIRTAWAKGLGERTVIVRHALRNALIPVVTIIGLQIPILIGGSVVLETIFSLPGIGRFLIEALQRRDYPVISGINVFEGIFVLIINLIVDLTYAWLDPRVKYT